VALEAVVTSPMCRVEPGLVPHALLVPGLSSAAGLCHGGAQKPSALSLQWLCRVARCVPCGDVPCIWVEAVSRVDAKDGAAAVVRFSSAQC